MVFGLFETKVCVTDATFGRVLNREDVLRVKEVWTQYCDADGLAIPKTCISELDKRIRASSKDGGGKAKFNFARAGLDDVHIKYLLRVLALSPCTNKIDLSGNAISNKVAEVVLKLLKGQLNLIKMVDVDQRLDACFLTEVKLLPSSLSIKDDTNKEIMKLTSTLKWGNAEAHIRKLYLQEGGPEAIAEKFLRRMWELVIGPFDSVGKTEVASAIARAENQRDHFLNYREMEDLLLRALVHNSQILPALSDRQLEEIRPQPKKQAPEPVVKESPPPAKTVTIAAGAGETKGNAAGKAITDKDKLLKSGSGTGTGSPSNRNIFAEVGFGKGSHNNLAFAPVNITGKSNSSRASLTSSALKLFGSVDDAAPGNLPGNLKKPFNTSKVSGHGQETRSNSSDEKDVGPAQLQRTGSGGGGGHSMLADSNKPAMDMIAKNKLAVVQAATRMRRASLGAPMGQERIIDHDAWDKSSIGSNTGPLVKAPHIGGTSDAQRSSGYGASPGSSGGAVRRRQSTVFSRPVLHASPVISSTISQGPSTTAPIEADPAPDSAKPIKRASIAPVHINKNIQHIKELQEAQRKAAETGINAKLLLAQKRRTSLMMDVASKSTGSLFDASPLQANPASRSTGQIFSAIKELDGEESTDGDSTVNSNRGDRVGQTKTGETDEYGIQTVNSPVGGAHSLMYDDEEDRFAASSAREEGSPEEKQGSRDVIGDAGGTEELAGVHQKVKKSRGRMSIIEASVPGMYRPLGHFDQQHHAALAREIARKKALEEQEAKEALDREERETLKVLDFANYELEYLDLGSISVLQNSPKAFSNILVLILRSNKLFDMNELGLIKLTKLTDLDLGSNRLVGPIPINCIPATVERLDMSYNKITDISTVIHITSLKVFNVKNNSVKTLNTTPLGLESLDISFNQLSSTLHLRMLSLSPVLKTLSIAGNPIAQTNADIKSVVSSILPSVLTLDGVIQPGHKVRSSDVKGLKGKNNGGTVDRVNEISLNRFNNSLKKGKESIHEIEQPSSPPKKAASGYTSPTGFLSRASSVAGGPAPRSRKEQIETDRARVALQALRHDVLKEAQLQKQQEEHKEILPYKKKIAPDDVDKLLHRLTHNGKRTERDPGFHREFSKTAAGRALSPTRPFFGGSQAPHSSKSTPRQTPAYKTSKDFADEHTLHTEAAGVLHSWIKERVLELGKASSALSGLFKLAQTPTIGARDEWTKFQKGCDKFLKEMNRISFLRSIDLPEKVEQALGVFSVDDNNATILVDLAGCIEQLAMMSSTLLDINAIVIEVNNGLYQPLEACMLLERGIDDILDTTNGAAVNDRILTSFSCQYKSKTKKQAPPTPTFSSASAAKVRNKESTGEEFAGDLLALVQSTQSPVVKPQPKLETAEVKSTVDSMKERLRNRAAAKISPVDVENLHKDAVESLRQSSAKAASAKAANATQSTTPAAATVSTISTTSSGANVELAPVDMSHIQTKFATGTRSSKGEAVLTQSIQAPVDRVTVPEVSVLDSHNLTSATLELSDRLDELLVSSALPLSSPQTSRKNTQSNEFAASAHVRSKSPAQAALQEPGSPDRDRDSENEPESSGNGIALSFHAAELGSYDRHLALLYGGPNGGGVSDTSAPAPAPAPAPAQNPSMSLFNSFEATSATSASGDPFAAWGAPSTSDGASAATTSENITPPVSTGTEDADGATSPGGKEGGGGGGGDKMSAKDRIKARMEAKRAAK